VLEGNPYLHHGSLPQDSEFFAGMRDLYDWKTGAGTLDLPPLPLHQLDVVP